MPDVKESFCSIFSNKIDRFPQPWPGPITRGAKKCLKKATLINDCGI
jgi:hypothetical protein